MSVTVRVPTTLRTLTGGASEVSLEGSTVGEVLTSLGYLDGDAVTDRGRHLMRIYSDMDLVAAEALRRGLWDGLSAPELAAVLSVLVFEARRADDASMRWPGGLAKPVIGEPYYLVAKLDWDDMESQGAALDSEAGNKTAEDAITNLSRYTTIRGMIVQLDDK